jgi:hypothetical protein
MSAGVGLTMSVPSYPSTITSSSLSMTSVRRGTPMTAGMKSDFAMIDVCEVLPPDSVANPTIGFWL